MSSTGKKIGIDLGTAYSVVAHMEGGRPRVLRDPNGQAMVPSVVHVDGEELHVGEAALRRWIVDEDHVVRRIKQAIGRDDYLFQGKTAVEISAAIVRTMKNLAEAELGVEVREAVITCPAYFAQTEIERTQEAGELAGLTVREIVKEPVAASIYYGVDHMKDGETTLVCDLGGGTYDATVLRYADGVFHPLATMGDRRLGGHNWTMELLEMVAEMFLENHGQDPRNDLAAAQHLFEACEQAKRDLASVPDVTIATQIGGQLAEVTVHQDAFEDRTSWLIEQVVDWSVQSLQKSQLQWSELDRILLVGGSSRLRQFGLQLQETSGLEPVQTGEPDYMVALGAAILAEGEARPRRGGAIQKIVAKRTVPRSLGTRVIASSGELTNSMIVAAGAEIPTSMSRDDYEISRDGQDFVEIPVLEYEDADDIEVIGNYKFRCREAARRGDRVEITFHYDTSGRVRVDARDLTSGEEMRGDRVPYQEPEVGEGEMVASPRWVVFAVDVSYSMSSDGKLETAKDVLIDNAGHLLADGGGCEVGVVAFGSDATVVVPPTNDLGSIERSVRDMEIYGSTAMHSGIAEAARLLQGAPSGTDLDLIMLTDGMPDEEAEALAAAEDARRQGVKIASLGIGRGTVDVEFLERLSPIVQMIDKVEAMAAAVGNLLTAAAASRRN